MEHIYIKENNTSRVIINDFYNHSLVKDHTTSLMHIDFPKNFHRGVF